MKHNRKTINGKLRAYNTGRGTLQEFVDEVKAFFEELHELKQKPQSPIRDMLGLKLISIDEVLGESKDD